MVYRKAEMAARVGGHKYLIDEVFPDHDDASADPDYIYESMFEEDPLEYDSDAESDRDDSVKSDSDEDEDKKVLADEWIFEIEPTPPTFDTEFLPLSTRLGTRLSTCLSDGRSQGHVEGIIKASHMEHIAGPLCKKTNAFMPGRISPEEMRNCHTVQCLLLKTSGWEPEADDLDFERDSRYFLSGVAERMSTSLWDVKTAPVRHGVDEDIRAQTDLFLGTVSLPLRYVSAQD
jgi:hypothetical protein